MENKIDNPKNPGKLMNFGIGNGDLAFDTVIDNLVDQLIIISRDFRILYANQAFLAFHGKTPEQIIGVECYRVSHNLQFPCRKPDCECPLVPTFQTGNPCIVTHRHVSRKDNKTNEIFAVISASPVKNRHGDVVAVTEVMHDITKVAVTERLIEETYRDLLALGSISSVVSQSLHLDTVLANALEMLLDIMKTEVGGIFLIDAEKQMLYCRAHRGFSGLDVDKVFYPLDEDVNGYVFNTGELIMADDVKNDPRTIRSALIISENVTSFISVPLVTKGVKLGVLFIASRKPRQFSMGDTRFLAAVVPQIAMAVENALLHREVENKEQDRGDLLKELFSIQEEERRRIARELHDETGQAIASLSASLEAILRDPDNDLGKTTNRIKLLQPILPRILEEIHRIIYELRPSILDDLGLIPAIRWLATNKLEQNGIRVKVKSSGRNQRLPSVSEASLYRVIQEAVTNITRHSKAKNALITIKFLKNSLKVHIADDGCGFDFDGMMKFREGPRGLGLLGMKERIEFMGGRLNITSQLNSGGTYIDIEIPFTCPIPVRPLREND
jgi:signal transduction histidine kinase